VKAAGICGLQGLGAPAGRTYTSVIG